ncbi:MAG: Hsp20/alpha crystallin family protein [Methanobacteriaceae archaeon]|nr:Hsp20/alpha crystallin family protein [Methanobacteriaceae archaeon]MDO9626645.1 Hsp20/alpha crystallin family protein [Methanobacteriaceae archaeon]
MRNDITESKHGMKKNTQKKVEKGKDWGEEKKEGVKNKMGDAKDSAKDMKEDASSRIEEVKEDASDKKEEVEEKLGEFKKEAEDQKEKLEKESKKEGVTPAEKLLNDLVSKFKEGKVQIDEAISDYKKPETSSKPLVDVLETNDTIILIVDISGVKKEDIDIGISRNRVEITAMFQKEHEIEGAKFTQKERCYGKINRTINLSTEIKVKEATAKYKECKLTITLPKVVEEITKVNIED